MKIPLIFQPILKQKVWGGTRLLSKASQKVGLPIGESWEISDVDDNSSLVMSDTFAGKTLHDIFVSHGDYLLGDARKSIETDRFPLLLKLLDSSDDLSLQVHPDDHVARIHHGAYARGKHEAWFIIDAMPEAEFYYGLASNFTQNTFQETMQNGELNMVFNAVPVRAGDYIDVPPGTIHGIGKGVLLAEIQDASDITYRLYDWNRLPARKLHIAEAMDSINFKQYDMKNFPSIGGAADSYETCLIDNNKFSVTRICFAEHRNIERDTRSRSFHIVLSLGTVLEVETNGTRVLLRSLETCLIPAASGRYRLSSPYPDGAALIFSLSNGNL